MTLWSIFRSPLIMGGDLPILDEFTLSLLTNEEVLKVNQASSGNRELFHRGEKIAWVADDPAGDGKYLALFNLGDTESVSIEVNLSDFQGSKKNWQVRDLWQKQNLGVFENT